jgi:hypothetical protein
MITMPAPKAPPVLTEIIDKDNAAISAPPFFIKGFLGGLTGSGKTQSALTLPGKSLERPLLLIDLDNRWETARDLVEAGLVKVVTIFDQDPESPKAWNKLERLRQELWAAVNNGTFPYSGIIEDGLSMLASYAKNSAVTLRGKDGKDNTGIGGAPSPGHWGAQVAYIEKHVNSLRNLPCHYILTGHFDIEKNEEDGKLHVMPKVTKSLRPVIPSWFNEVYYCHRKQGTDGRVEYYWTTAGTEMYEFFKSTMNLRQQYWIDPIKVDFPKRADWWNGEPVGFSKLVKTRFGI